MVCFFIVLVIVSSFFHIETVSFYCSFYVNEKFYYGTDRLFFVERAVGENAHPERLMSPPSSGTATLTFYFDYSSPWSYLGFERLHQLAKDVHPVNLKIEWVPILLGALFKNIGTPNVSVLLGIPYYSHTTTCTQL